MEQFKVKFTAGHAADGGFSFSLGFCPQAMAFSGCVRSVALAGVGARAVLGEGGKKGVGGVSLHHVFSSSGVQYALRASA